jgi:hypothetical protein
MNAKSTETKVNELAAQVLPESMLASFITLPLKSKLVGIAFFAKIDENEPMMNAALKTLRYMERR